MLLEKKEQAASFEKIDAGGYGSFAFAGTTCGDFFRDAKTTCRARRHLNGATATLHPFY
jgi:hypothetical protein